MLAPVSSRLRLRSRSADFYPKLFSLVTHPSRLGTRADRSKHERNRTRGPITIPAVRFTENQHRPRLNRKIRRGVICTASQVDDGAEIRGTRHNYIRGAGPVVAGV